MLLLALHTMGLSAWSLYQLSVQPDICCDSVS